MKLILLFIFILTPICTEFFSQSYTYNIRIAAHVILDAQGQGISTSDIDLSISQVNTRYNNADINFTKAFTDYIDDSYYRTGEKINFAPISYTFQQKLQDLFDEKNDIGVIHLYFIKKEFTTGGYAGVSEDIPGYKIVITNEDAINGETLAHEIGHCLGLLHTYEGTKFNIQPNNLISWSDGGQLDQPEWVARQGYACSNSLSNGDLLNDTPADPISDESGIAKFVFNCNFANPNNIRDNSSCQNLYVGVLINNMMALPVGCSRTTFTTGQISRMKLFLDDRLASINNTIPVVVANKFNGGVIPNSEIKPSTLKIDVTDYNSGSIVYLIEDDYTGKTNQERFVNYQSSNIKHHDWNGIFSQYHLTENFMPTEITPFRDADFLPMNYSKIEARLEGQIIQSKGDFHFLDPWYVKSDGTQPGNYWIPCTEFYEPTGKSGEDEKGVFLNQDPSQTPTYYKVKVDQTQDVQLTNTGYPAGRWHKFYFQNWGGSYVQYQNANALETGVVFTNTNATSQANLKGTQLSQNSNAYNTNSQRKYVKTDNGYLHSVYESMGKVWYEVSSNNGSTWVLQNNGYPISTSGKQPAIDYHYFYDSYSGDTYHQTVIVWQEQYGSNSKIKIAYFHRVFDSPSAMEWIDTDDVATVTGTYSSTNCTPIVCLYASDLRVVFKNGNSGALMCRQGLVNIVSGTYLYGSGPTTLTSTNSNSVNPSIAVNKTGTTTVRLVWEQITNVSNSSVKYAVISGSQISGSISTISTGSGYPLNFSPSISVANNYPVVSWTVGIYTGQISYRRAVTSRGTTWGTFQITGTDVNFVNNNSVISASEKSVIVWSEGITTPISKWMKRTSTVYSTPATLSNSGIQSQVCGGTDYQYMSAMVFKNTSLPYYFLKSTTDFSVENPGEEDVGGFNKITETDTIVTFGRSGVAEINGIEFAFNIGDILVGDSIIKFIEVPDTLFYSSFNDLNAQTRTESFAINQETDFYFTNIYYTVEKSDPDSALTETDEVNFKTELVNTATGNVVGIFDNITYNKNNLQKYASIDYQVDCSGITSGEYYLRLVTNVIGDAGYSLGNIVNDNTTLAKKKYVKVNFIGNGIPITYSLEQNYPNPFNPATTIRYQIPKDGIVTLKVYDILGAEVATLVNEEKVAGKYEVNFNASGHSGNVRNLASGVYIYRLSVNDFVNVKKMVLLK